jgi:hypothetical protein
MNRKECLTQADEIVHNDRNTDYGEPEDNFTDIATYWTTFLGRKLKGNVQITSSDVAAMSILIKMSRIQVNPKKEDHWVDVCGYGACGAECATKPLGKLIKPLPELTEREILIKKWEAGRWVEGAWEEKANEKPVTDPDFDAKKAMRIIEEW